MYFLTLAHFEVFSELYSRWSSGLSSGKVPLECNVMLQNGSQTHSQASWQVSRLQSCHCADARRGYSLRNPQKMSNQNILYSPNPYPMLPESLLKPSPNPCTTVSWILALTLPKPLSEPLSIPLPQPFAPAIAQTLPWTLAWILAQTLARTLPCTLTWNFT